MAVGFPAKTDFATGDVLTATNVNDITGTLNLLQSAQYAAAKNIVINGAMSIWQRGTSIAGATGYTANTADRWNSFRGTFAAGSTVSRQTTSDTTNLPFIQYCARVARDVGNTSTALITFNQTFESANSIPFAGKTVVLSFYARKGANYSQALSQLATKVFSGTGTDQNVQSGFTGNATVISQEVVLTTTWQRFTVTGTVGSTATQLGIIFQYAPVGTAGGADYFEITGVQLEAASTATPFQTASGSIGGELALCQRYYFRTSSSTTFGALASTAWAQSATLTEALVKLPVTMRAAPTTFDGSGVANLSFVNYAGSTFTLTGGATITTAQTTPDTVKLLCGSTGMTAGHVGNWAGNASGYISFGAEL